MKKEALKKHVAMTAYNVGYGAKKHLATYDIVEKAPGWIGLVSIAFGVLALIIPALEDHVLSALLIILGVGGLYISFYVPTNSEYMKVGSELTGLVHKLRFLYDDVDAASDSVEFVKFRGVAEKIQEDAQRIAIAKQIFLSDWYAHYKFFGQSQTQWLVDELGLTFWRDKMPRTLLVVLIASVLACLVCFLVFAVHVVGVCMGGAK